MINNVLPPFYGSQCIIGRDIGAYYTLINWCPASIRGKSLEVYLKLKAAVERAVSNSFQVGLQQQNTSRHLSFVLLFVRPSRSYWAIAEMTWNWCQKSSGVNHDIVVLINKRTRFVISIRGQIIYFLHRFWNIFSTQGQLKQVAQLSQRDRAARWVSYGQKWKTGTGRQYLRIL